MTSIFYVLISLEFERRKKTVTFLNKFYEFFHFPVILITLLSQQSTHVCITLPRKYKVLMGEFYIHLSNYDNLTCHHHNENKLTQRLSTLTFQNFSLFHSYCQNISIKTCGVSFEINFFNFYLTWHMWVSRKLNGFASAWWSLLLPKLFCRFLMLRNVEIVMTFVNRLQ